MINKTIKKIVVIEASDEEDKSESLSDNDNEVGKFLDPKKIQELDQNSLSAVSENETISMTSPLN